jgi:hypothetical protein
MNETNLHLQALLVDLTIRSWTARKQDKKATRDVCESHGVSSDAAIVTKQLVARASTAKIVAARGALTKEVHFWTSPWGPHVRILAAKNFFRLRESADAKIAEFNAAVDEFVPQYPAIVESARLQLNGLFSPDDYPPPDSIREHFGVELRFLPLPAAQDFRISLRQDALDELRATLTAETAKALASTSQDIARRLVDALNPLLARLREYDPDKKHAKFHGSLISNLREIASCVPDLNLAHDQELNARAREIVDMLSSVDVEDVRENAGVRASLSGDVQAILDKMASFGA